VKKKASVNFLTDPRDRRSTLRSTNITVYGYIARKHTRVDLTRVSPLVGFGIIVFMVGHATLKIVSSKVVKHEKTCSDN